MLKLADVGIAIDQGYDIVKATADVVILANNLVYMTNNINLLYELLHSAKRTFRLVRANT
jgi:cation transport ATPase